MQQKRNPFDLSDSEVESIGAEIVSKILQMNKPLSEDKITRIIQKAVDSQKDVNFLDKNTLGLNCERIIRTFILGSKKGLRLDNNSELEYTQLWMHKNNTSLKFGRVFFHDFILGGKSTQEERVAMNTLIQWLGTPVGEEFVESVLKIKKEKK